MHLEISYENNKFSKKHCVALANYYYSCCRTRISILRSLSSFPTTVDESHALSYRYKYEFYTSQ